MLHTLNIRLFPEQLTYIVNHADDEVIFVDRSLLALLAPLLPTFERVRHLVLMDDGKGEVPEDLHGHTLLDYEELIGAAAPVEFRIDDEHRAASMCYTSGTTGNPKGVVYTHRSTFLHTMSALTADSVGVREADRVLPVVPMFHANAWGLAHAGVAAGADLIMPGPDLSGKAIADLVVEERVSVAAGVPTIWMQALPELKGRDTSALRAIPCGGSAVPKALSEAYRETLGLPILQAWGMTETSPVVSVARLDRRPGAAAAGGAGRAARRPGSRRARRRAARRRARHDDARPARRRGERRAAGPRQLDRGDVLRRPARRPRASPTTAGCARATWRR